jgi:RNA polymerase sigma factor (sigma-70 family)
MDETTEQLPERLAADVDGAFVDLVRCHAPAVYSTLLRLSGSAADADDLGQETFLRAYTALCGYPAQRRRALRLRPWLTTIAVNAWRNQQRGAARRPVSVMPVEELPRVPADGRPGPEEAAATAEVRARLVVSLARLPEAQRLAVVLRHVADLSYQELAEVMGCPVGTAKAHVSRGVGTLRGLLDTPGQEVAG